MAFDWQSLGKTIAQIALQTGVRAAERGIDSVLEDADKVLAEGRRRVQKARSQIPKGPPSSEAEEDEGPTIIDAVFDDERKR
jgi:hypothetical protein